MFDTSDTDRPPPTPKLSRPRTGFGLDRRHGLTTKLGYTLTMFVLAAFLFLFTALVFTAPRNPWWQVPAQLVLETCWVFWLTGTLFIWWRPLWLRKIYLSVERKMALLAKAFIVIAVIMAIVTFVLLTWLHHEGILPAKPH